MNESPNALLDALDRVLAPLVRLLIGSGVRHGALADRLKRLYVEAADRDFALPGKRMTDSRLSLLTGLQRRDIKALRKAPPAAPARHGPLPRVLGRWSAEGGAPLDRASLENLIREVSRDMHPRTVIDELVRQGTVIENEGAFRLAANAWLPRDEAGRLGYFGGNLGDHAAAASANLLAPPGEAPFFERAVHYNRLTPGSLAKLEVLARALQAESLTRLNAEAAALQQADAERPGAAGRFRCGAYILTDPGDPE